MNAINRDLSTGNAKWNVFIIFHLSLFQMYQIFIIIKACGSGARNEFVWHYLRLWMVWMSFVPLTKNKWLEVANDRGWVWEGKLEVFFGPVFSFFLLPVTFSWIYVHNVRFCLFLCYCWILSNLLFLSCNMPNNSEWLFHSVAGCFTSWKEA